MLSPKTLTVAAAISLAGHVAAHPSLETRQAGKFTLYDIPTPAAGPCDLVQGLDGALWGEDILIDKVFRLDPNTGNIQEFSIPFSTGITNATIPGVTTLVQNRVAFACAIRTGGDGNLYAAQGVRNQLVRINPTTKKIDVFTPPGGPAGNLQPFNDLTEAPGGIYLTQTTGNVFQFFDFATESFTTYNIPTPLSLPLGLKVASNGLLYVAELLGNAILEFNPKTKEIKEYPIPILAQLPAVVRAERNGWLYFSLFTGDGLGRINLNTKTIEVYPSSQLGGLGSEDTIDSKGGVWLSYFTADVMARLDTNTLKYKYVPFPGTFAQGGLSGLLGDVPPYVDVAVNYGPGDAIWFTSLTKNQVGRYSLS